MRQKDIAIIAAVAVLSAVLSLVLSRLMFAKPADRNQQVEVVQPISADFPQPDNRYFNAKSFDPTQPIVIGNGVNPEPFRGQQ